MQICHCRNFSFDQAEKRPAPKSWQANEAWYCLQCNLIHHAAAEERAVVRGPKDAIALLHASMESDGQVFYTWRLQSGEKAQTVEFQTYPRSVGVMQKEPTIFSLWELLMTKVEVIMAEPNGVADNALEADRREIAKHQARGIAEVLALLMKPFITDADTVVRHAVKRYKNPDHEVPGLGMTLWDPFVHTSVKLKKPEPTVHLTPEQIASLGEAYNSGMFKAEELASSFKVSVDFVRSLKS